MSKEKAMNPKEKKQLLLILEDRFLKNMQRHPDLSWGQVTGILDKNEDKLWSLWEMEGTGGEPDVVAMDGSRTGMTFVDCCKETPQGRRSFCYDQEALEKRKNNKPENSAKAAAAAMGIDLLTEEQYRQLQKLEAFDLKTSSWIQTPDAIRKLGGALFCDRRYNTVFVYHNGADSYYGSRGFRGILEIS